MVFNRVGGVDDQVENNLIQQVGKAGHHGQIRIKISDHFSRVFPFVTTNGNGTAQGAVQIRGDLVIAAGVAEFLHR